MISVVYAAIAAFRSGACTDRAVGVEVIDRLQPLGIQAALDKRRADDAGKRWQIDLERFRLAQAHGF